MDEQTPLSEALGEAPETQPTETAQPEPEVTQETTPETTEPEGSTPEPETWTKAAVMDERSKRQEAQSTVQQLEKELAQYKGYIQALQPQQQTEAPQAPDFWEDPEKAITHIQDSLRGEFTDRLNTVESEHKNVVLTMSEQMMAQHYDDFETVKAHVLQMAQSNPAVIQQAAHSNPTHPWKAVYEHGRKDMELQQVGDLDAFKAKLKDELKAEALAEVKAELEAKGKGGKVPESLVNHPTSTVKGGEWSGPTSLDSILK